MKKILPLLFLILSFALTFRLTNAASLEFVPETSSTVLGKVGTANIVLTHEENETSLGTEVYLNYDPSYIEILSINPAQGKVADSWVQNFTIVDNNSGNAQFSIIDENVPFSGTFTLASVNYRPKSIGESKIEFITGENFGTSSIIDYSSGYELLTKTTPLNLNITEDVCANLRCDFTGDEKTDILDLIVLIRYVFGG